MEYVEVWDDQGRPTGIIKPRHEVHRTGEWQPTVDVWLINPRGELLLQQRSIHKEGNPLKWNSSSAGHVTAGTTPLFTARQETIEEIGLDLPESNFRFLFTSQELFVMPNQTTLARELAHVYIAEADISTTALRLQAEEVTDVRWVACAELERLIKEGDPQLVSHPEQYAQLFAYLRERFGR